MFRWFHSSMALFIFFCILPSCSMSEENSYRSDEWASRIQKAEALQKQIRNDFWSQMAGRSIFVAKMKQVPVKERKQLFLTEMKQTPHVYLRILMMQNTWSELKEALETETLAHILEHEFQNVIKTPTKTEDVFITRELSSIIFLQIDLKLFKEAEENVKFLLPRSRSDVEIELAKALFLNHRKEQAIKIFQRVEKRLVKQMDNKNKSFNKLLLDYIELTKSEVESEFLPPLDRQFSFIQTAITKLENKINQSFALAKFGVLVSIAERRMILTKLKSAKIFEQAFESLEQIPSALERVYVMGMVCQDYAKAGFVQETKDRMKQALKEISQELSDPELALELTDKLIFVLDALEIQREYNVEIMNEEQLEQLISSATLEEQSKARPNLGSCYAELGNWIAAEKLIDNLPQEEEKGPYYLNLISRMVNPKIKPSSSLNTPNLSPQK